MPDSAWQTKVSAVLGLMAVQITVGVLYRVAQAHGGGFHFSTMSAIAIAETSKLAITVALHVADPHRENGSSAWAAAVGQLSLSACLHIFSLASLYTLNNQLAFYVAIQMDPGTIFLFKAANALIVAAIQMLCVGRRFSGEQIRAMVLQMIGIIIVQHDPCRGHGRYPLRVYGLMAFSVGITAVCTVRNEYIVKHYRIALNVQNSVLYASGAALNVTAFFLVSNPSSAQAGLGFFDGYDSPLAVAVVACNTLIGIAINLVYKYADAVLKCIATDCTAVVLCIISAIFFNLRPSLTLWCGVCVVCYAVYSYSMAARPTERDPEASRALVREVSMQGSIQDEMELESAREAQRPMLQRT